MRIGIIGLLPDQVNVIKAAFPKYHFEFLPREREREAKEFATRQAKVVLMTNFISHSTQAGVPTHKRVLVTGGMTKLRHILTALASEVITITHAPKADKKEVVVPKIEKLNFAPLRGMKVGEEFIILRPAHTTIKQWEAKITTARSYYSTTYGIKTKVAFKDNAAVLTVTKRTKDVIDAPVLQDHESPAAKYFAETPLVVPGDKDFWQRTFLVLLAGGTKLPTALKEADVALEALRSRFPL